MAVKNITEKKQSKQGDEVSIAYVMQSRTNRDMLYELLSNVISEAIFKVIIRQLQSHITTQTPIIRGLVKLQYDQVMEDDTKAIKNDNNITDFPGGAVVKNPPAKAGDTGSSPDPGRSHMPQSNKAHAPRLLKPAL
ncbi:hypothetical protein J1605_011215 [Eschrichtius robustus]|uniref:Uncharacterized protein n=1 Tax=Eschrichtius robustus TaxID=9764 RepID=A0AB34GNZ0_ESCRO|nr:hypothetical protein J1605_011215 [Eschrichtius robustus]